MVELEREEEGNVDGGDDQRRGGKAMMAGVHFVNSAAVHSGCWLGCLCGLRRRWTCNTLGIEILSYFDLCSSVPISSSIRYPVQRDAASLYLRNGDV